MLACLRAQQHARAPLCPGLTLHLPPLRHSYPLASHPNRNGNPSATQLRAGPNPQDIGGNNQVNVPQNQCGCVYALNLDANMRCAHWQSTSLFLPFVLLLGAAACTSQPVLTWVRV